MQLYQITGEQILMKNKETPIFPLQVLNFGHIFRTKVTHSLYVFQYFHHGAFLFLKSSLVSCSSNTPTTHHN